VLDDLLPGPLEIAYRLLGMADSVANPGDSDLIKVNMCRWLL
jgi:hypothetical protein